MIMDLKKNFFFSNTKTETVFKSIVTYSNDNNIPLKNRMACAINGALSIVIFTQTLRSGRIWHKVNV